MINLRTADILVTGSAGFIGKHLTKRLLELGCKTITLLDIREKNFQRGGIRGVRGSLADTALVRELLVGRDIVFQLAAVVGVDKTLHNQAELRDINLIATKKLIDMAVRSGVRKIVFSSSSEIYGNSKSIPFRESSRVQPVSQYARYKLIIERYLRKLAEAGRVQSTVVRFFNVYGPGQREDFVINRFMHQAMEGRDLVVNWDGNQTRCFTYIDDAVKGLTKAAEYDRRPFDIFNIGTTQEVSMLELARLAIELTGSKHSDIVIANKHRVDRYEVTRRVPSLEKSNRVFAYAPEVDLKQGLSKILNAT
jgi:dTDP-alpha-D-glucuronic acid decarboxylase